MLTLDGQIPTSGESASRMQGMVQKGRCRGMLTESPRRIAPKGKRALLSEEEHENTRGADEGQQPEPRAKRATAVSLFSFLL